MDEKIYRVILEGVGENSEEEKLSFCRNVSERYGIPLEPLIAIANRCPIVIKKDIPFKKAERLAKALEICGASLSIERRRSLCPISLESPLEGASVLALISAMVRKTAEDYWEVLGKVKNISNQELVNVWALIQALDEHDELIGYEEVPLPIDPLPPNASTPFKVLFERDLPVKKFSLSFKTALKALLSVRDSRQRREWIEVPSSFEDRPMGAIQDRAKRVEESQDFKEAEQDIFQTELNEQEQGEASLSTPKSEERSKETEVVLDLKEEGPLPEEDAHSLEKLKEGEELHLDVTDEEELQEPFRMEVRHDRQEDAEDRLMVRETEEVSTYPWLDAFRRSVEEMDLRSRTPFLSWFRTLPKENDLGEPKAFLLAVLIYARFNQSRRSDSALENTQRVFLPTLQEEVSEEDIPTLQGDLFFPPEVWRELYLRAVPRLKEVVCRIIERPGWKTADLDRLIRIIPHMTASNSRWAIRLLHDEIPGIVPDISDLEVDIQEGLYRVAARLGVVNPLFDLFQGKGSMGDKKIQTFAKLVFPEDPLKIEDPMNRIGAKEGFCLPKQPLCPDCPLFHFCPKNLTDVDPSEKGMLWKSSWSNGGFTWKV